MNTLFKYHSIRGSVLVVTLLILTILTIIAVAEMSSNTTQTRIATNITDAQIAFQTAQGALNDATNNLFANTYASTSFLSNSNGLYIYNPNQAALWSTVNWSSPSAVIMSFQGRSNTQAAYIIEQLPSVISGGQNENSPTQVYRITVRAVGASGGSPVILQSTINIQL